MNSEFKHPVDGDRVVVRYTGVLMDGTEFDSKDEKNPLVFTVGKEEVTPGFENAVKRLYPGEAISTRIPAKMAFGEHREELVKTVPRNLFPEGVELVPDRPVQSEAGIMAVIKKVTDTEVVIDGNPPLAGQNLAYKIELVEILD